MCSVKFSKSQQKNPDLKHVRIVRTLAKLIWIRSITATFCFYSRCHKTEFCSWRYVFTTTKSITFCLKVAQRGFVARPLLWPWCLKPCSNCQLLLSHLCFSAFWSLSALWSGLGPASGGRHWWEQACLLLSPEGMAPCSLETPLPWSAFTRGWTWCLGRNCALLLSGGPLLEGWDPLSQCSQLVRPWNSLSFLTRKWLRHLPVSKHDTPPRRCGKNQFLRVASKIPTAGWRGRGGENIASVLLSNPQERSQYPPFCERAHWYEIDHLTLIGAYRTFRKQRMCHFLSLWVSVSIVGCVCSRLLGVCQLCLHPHLIRGGSLEEVVGFKVSFQM